MFELCVQAKNGTVKNFHFFNEEKANKIKTKLLGLGWTMLYMRVT